MVEVHLGGVLGNAFGVRDLGEGELAEDAEGEDALLTGREVGYEGAQTGAERGPGFGNRAESRFGNVIQGDVVALGAEDVATFVHGNAMEPGSEARLAAEAAKALEGVDEGALGGLVCRVVVAQHAPGQGMDAPLVALDEGFEGRLVAREGPSD